MTKHQKIVILLVVSLILIASLLFLGRGLVRTLGYWSYATLVYKPGVDKTFNEYFSPVNSQLGALGLGISSAQSIYDGCDGGYYSGLSATSTCMEDIRSINYTITNDLVTKWQNASPMWQSLEKTGWKKFGTQDNPSELLDQPQDIDFGYTKNSDGTQCNIWFRIESQRQLFVDEQCMRTINFFGGY